MKTQNIPPTHTQLVLVFVLIELLKVTKCPINSISNIHLYLKKNIPIIVYKLIYFHLQLILLSVH